MKNKFPEYYSYQGRKISKKLSFKKKNLIFNHYNQFSFDNTIIGYHNDKSLRKKIVFPDHFKKINIEIGFGNGEFLINNAITKPDELFIGVEVYLNGIANVLEKILSLKLKNVILSNLNSIYFLEATPEKSVDTVYIINPDPWIKKRHNKRRLMSYEIITVLKKIIKTRYSIHMTTDSKLYINDTEKLLNKYKKSFGEYYLRTLSTNDKLYGISRYQQKAIENGREIYLLTF